MRFLPHMISGAIVAVLAVFTANAYTSPSKDVTKPSALSERLADVHVGSSIPAAQRDYLETADLVAWSTERRKNVLGQAREAKCLSEAIYYEARSETRAGQKAVAEVVLNRVGSKHFPNTVCGVVYQGAERRTGCQFSFTCDGSRKNTPRGRSWERSKDIAAMALTNAYAPVTGRATHYHTTAVNPKWAPKLKKTDQYGTHMFYRFKTRREKRESASAAINLAPPPI